MVQYICVLVLYQVLETCIVFKGRGSGAGNTGASAIFVTVHCLGLCVSMLPVKSFIKNRNQAIFEEVILSNSRGTPYLSK